MAGKNNTKSDDYLETLEEIKKQYQEYIEVSKIYELPVSREEEPARYQSPSPEHPLTTNSFRVK